MLQLLTGILLFFGIHSVSIVALPLRDSFAAKSEYGWKAIYSLISVAGLWLMIQGYGELKQTPELLYISPAGLRHLAALLLLPAFILTIAPYFPGRITRAIKHPQLLGLQLWAVAHLMVNGGLADLLLFGSFLVWAVVDRISMMKRPSRAVPGVPESNRNDILLIVGGLVIYVVIAVWLHQPLFGVAPFG